jgi:hypothetical protein
VRRVNPIGILDCNIPKISTPLDRNLEQTYPLRLSQAKEHPEAFHRCIKMQSMQRQFGKLMRKGPGDNAKVSVLLNDYEDADKVLAQVRPQPPDPGPWSLLTPAPPDHR